jgi:hypothetical protein
MKRAGAHSSVPTAAGLKRITRRITRHSASVAQTLAVMENGAAPQMFYEQGRAIWKLSTGILITPETADAVIHNPNVTGVGDSLFGDKLASQTFRWIDNLEDKT